MRRAQPSDAVPASPARITVDPQIRPIRLGAGIFSLFGALSLGLAALGMYAALSYAVGQRRREIGIRIALGAGLRKILLMILGDGLRAVLTGVVAGSVPSVLLLRWIRAYLFETAPREPRVLAASILVLFCVATFACLLPALRAGRTDPNHSLRLE